MLNTPDNKEFYLTLFHSLPQLQRHFKTTLRISHLQEVKSLSTKSQLPVDKLLTSCKQALNALQTGQTLLHHKTSKVYLNLVTNDIIQCIICNHRVNAKPPISGVIKPYHQVLAQSSY